MPDGRTLGYAVFGPPEAPPVLYCHGWPSCRLEAGLIADLPVRVIAADRPGYSLSTPHPQARLTDHARDIERLADAMGLERFCVVGMSGGGPLAAACAHLMGDRVAALGLISAVPEPSKAMMMSGGLRWLLRVAGIEAVAQTALPLGRRLLLAGLAERLMFTMQLPPRDAEILTPALRSALLGVFREAVRPGAHGAVADALLYAQPWEFDLADIRTPTVIWHGTEDHLVPPAAVHSYAVIPGSQLHVLEGEGHYSLALGQGHAILQSLQASAAA